MGFQPKVAEGYANTVGSLPGQFQVQPISSPMGPLPVEKALFERCFRFG